MSIFEKSEGLTPSERYLANLGERSFLRLWSYPNVFKQPGTELCDLLVVCGDHVIVFSDKSIGWPEGLPVKQAWERWYRRAVAKSAAQVHGARRWILEHPDRLFLDAKCERKLPITLPDPARMKFHGVIVALGAAKACLDHFGSGSGSLVIMPTEARTRSKQEAPSTPFTIGNPSPIDDVVYHILDDISLTILLKELDTITDLSLYLEKRELLIKSNGLFSAHGEEDLLAIYLKDIDEDGDHNFIWADRKAISSGQMIVVEGGAYADMRRRPEYRRKKFADRISYTWDSLIDTFAKNVVQGTNYIVEGYEDHSNPLGTEFALRQMALVPRLERRSHSLAIKGAFESIKDKDRFFRAMIPGPGSRDIETAFFILLVKMGGVLSELSYEQYRTVRTKMLHVYALNILRLNRSLKQVVGIATEGEYPGRKGGRSEDLIYAEQPQWTPETEISVAEDALRMDILQPGAQRMRHIRPKEYPPAHHPQGGSKSPINYTYIPDRDGDVGNRASRRRAKALRRRLRK